MSVLYGILAVGSFLPFCHPRHDASANPQASLLDYILFINATWPQVMSTYIHDIQADVQAPSGLLARLWPFRRDTDPTVETEYVPLSVREPSESILEDDYVLTSEGTRKRSTSGHALNPNLLADLEAPDGPPRTRPSSGTNAPEQETGQPFAVDPTLPRETQLLTWRAVLIGSLLGLIVGASNIYLGLKTGFSFGASLFGCVQNLSCTIRHLRFDISAQSSASPY